MHPVLIDLFGFNLHTYGLMIALGFLVGMQLGVREARRVDVSANGGYDQFILDLTFWILISAMIGSRVLFVIVEWEDAYAKDPLKLIRFWEGGLVFYGGLIGAVLFSIYYCIKKGRKFLLVADTLIPSVALGQFFGRIGCFAAGCCWGDAVPAGSPFAVQFPAGSLAYNYMRNHEIISHDAPFTLHVHPVQMYESLGALTIFVILLFVRTRKTFHGYVLAGYLLLYPILRFTVEFFRGDANRGESVLGTPLSTSQFISLLLFGVGVALVVKKKLFTPPATA